MRQARWQKIEEIFHAAVEYNGREREEYLRRACGDDQATFIELVELLNEHENPSTGLLSPIRDIGLQMFDKPESGGRTGESIGHLRIGHLIGRGGMGEIYAAEDTKVGRTVAIKLINELVSSDPERVRRFQKEAQAALRVSHPNVARLHELCKIEGENLIVMEFVEGTNLRQHMADVMPLGKALDIAIQVASALVAAHAVGVVHRDIKPENIIITPDGSVKVLDFGLAKLVSPIGGAIHVHGGENIKLTVDMSTEFGALIGTPAYMSPEQIRSADVDTQTDIWSLGVLLHEMLTGELPFRGKTKIDVIAAVLISEPSPLGIIDIPLVVELNSVLLKMLSKDKSERYQTVDKVVADFSSIRKDLGPASEIFLTAGSFENKSTFEKEPRATGTIGFLSDDQLTRKTGIQKTEPAVSRFEYLGLVRRPGLYVRNNIFKAILMTAIPIVSIAISWQMKGSYFSTPLSGPVSYWPGDGNANDAIGSNDGELLNGAAYRPGVSGQAFSFDGIDDLMQAPTEGFPVGKNDRTLAMWVFVDEFPDIDVKSPRQDAFFAGYGKFGSYAQVYFLGMLGEYLSITNWGEGPGVARMESKKWYHIAATTAAGVTSLYLDGALAKLSEMTIDTATDTVFYVGKISGEHGEIRRLNGAVDDIQIYDRALSSAEIHALFSAHTPQNFSRSELTHWFPHFR